MNSLDERLLPPRTRHADSSGFTIVYHGTLAPHYGVGLIVEAAGALQGRVSGLRVEIYGEGDALPGLRARTAELGLEDAIELGGHYVPQEEVLFAVQNASVGVVPNLPIRLNQYALSTKLLEYVALGVPVVSADLPTIREHFSDEEVRYFKAGDAASLAEALAEVAEDPAAAVRRADAARRRYEEYRWERSARAYVDALHRATNSG
jgi:glycosyltransferase involved in cell wall biosynthesis